MKPAPALPAFAVLTLLVGLIAAALASPQSTPAASAERTSSPNLELHGVVLQGAHPSKQEWAEIGRSRMGTIRFPITWASIEGRPGVYRWHLIDDQVRRAVGTGARVIPFLWGTPAWVNSHPGHPPLGRSSQLAWRNFLQAVVQRYKPGSRFWRRGSKHGVRTWQIWNEVNHHIYWHPQPTPVGYAKLLHVSSKAIREVAPGAEIVLSGLTPASDAIPPMEYLDRLLEIPGTTSFFDTASIHPYARGMRDFKQQIISARALLREHGLYSTPLRITEFGWGSEGPAGVGRAGSYRDQAKLLRKAYRKIARNPAWGVASASWYGWRDSDGSLAHCSFCTSIGVRHVGGAPKPAWDSMQRSIRSNHAGKLGKPAR